MRKKARVDDNQNAVVKALRQITGVTVAITSQLGNGLPDFIVGTKGKNYMIELKDGKKANSKKKLTEDEQEFHDKWKGSIHVCESLDDVLNVINGKS